MASFAPSEQTILLGAMDGGPLLTRFERRSRVSHEAMSAQRLLIRQRLRLSMA